MTLIHIESEPEPGQFIDAPQRPQPTEGPDFHADLAQWADMVRGTVVRGAWYPGMPPSFIGETADQYTNRLTGADHLDLRPYDHRRFRQCSIGYHEECSQNGLSDSELECECPHHYAED